MAVPGRDRALARPNLAVAVGVPAARRRIARLLRQANRAIATLVELRPAWGYLSQFQQHFAPQPAVLADNTAEAAA